MSHFADWIARSLDRELWSGNVTGSVDGTASLWLHTTREPGLVLLLLQPHPDEAPIGLRLGAQARTQLAAALLTFASVGRTVLDPIRTPDPHGGTITFDHDGGDDLAVTLTVDGRTETCGLTRQLAGELGQQVAL